MSSSALAPMWTTPLRESAELIQWSLSINHYSEVRVHVKRWVGGEGLQSSFQKATIDPENRLRLFPASIERRTLEKIDQWEEISKHFKNRWFHRSLKKIPQQKAIQIFMRKKLQRTESTGLIFLTVIFSLGGKSMFNTFYEVSSSYYKKNIIGLKYTLN